MQWFGKPWGAPVCDPKARTATPVGELCAGCKSAIAKGARGLLVQHYEAGPFARLRPWHLDCWLRQLLGEPGRALVRGRL